MRPQLLNITPCHHAAAYLRSRFATREVDSMANHSYILLLPLAGL